MTDETPDAQLARARNDLQIGISLAERLADLALELRALADEARQWVEGVTARSTRGPTP